MTIRKLVRRRKRQPARGAALSLVRQIPRLLRLLFGLLRDPRVPGVDKLLLGAVVAYTLTPADLIPDILMPLGLVDDLYLLGLALARLFNRAGPDLLLEHWDGDPKELGFLVEGVDQIGGLLPGPVQRVLRRAMRKAG